MFFVNCFLRDKTKYEFLLIWFSPPEASWYSISYLWYAAIAISFTFVSGMLFSLIFKSKSKHFFNLTNV